MEAQIKGDQQQFLETVKHLQHRTVKCEDEAKIYCQKLEDYTRDFQNERSFFE